MAAPKVLEEMNFEEIKNLVLEKLQPKKKLVIAERTQFLSMRQTEAEDVRDYVHRLRNGARFCDFHKLGAANTTQSAEDELLQMRLIDGLKEPEDRIKLLEYMQSATGDVLLNNCRHLGSRGAGCAAAHPVFKQGVR